MLEIKNLSKTFNVNTINEKKALTNINLSLNDGDFVTVIGGNGAGKSTLMNMICGVYKPDNGQIVLNNKDLTNLPEYKRANFIGRVFQDPMMGTAANMQIVENLAIALNRGNKRTLRWLVNNNDKNEYKNIVKKLDLGLENRLTSQVGLLSGGQRQALTLLMATLKRPDLLLLDEHTAALDPKTADKVLTITNQLVRENNLTTLMITHNMHDAIKYGNRLIMMHEGQIIYDVQGEEKQKLTVKDLLNKFEEVAKEKMENDRMLLI